MRISDSELFEMNLYYREVIGRDGAPAQVKQIDIIKLLDHIADMDAAARKGSGVGFELPALKPKTAEIRARRAAAKKKAQQTDIFDFIGGDE